MSGNLICIFIYRELTFQNYAKKKGNVRPDTLQLFGARLQLEKNEREASQFLMARITESALDAATHT